MNTKRKLRRAMWLSGLLMLVCVVLLVGTTYAWFTDVASNKNNRIQSGHLRMQVIGFEKDGETPVGDAPASTGGGFTGDFADPQTKLINETQWYPGKMETKYIAIYNRGLIDFTYELMFIADSLGFGATPELVEVLLFKLQKVGSIPDDTVEPEMEEMVAFEDMVADYLESIGGTTNEIITGNLAASAVGTEDRVEYYRLDYAMCLNAERGTDDADLKSYGNREFDLDIAVTAIQERATLAEMVYIRNAADLIAAAADEDTRGKTLIFLNDVALYESGTTTPADITFTQPLNIDLNGYTLTAADITFDFDTGGTVDIGNSNSAANKDTVKAHALVFDTPTIAINLYGIYDLGGASIRIHEDAKYNDHELAFDGNGDPIEEGDIVRFPSS